MSEKKRKNYLKESEPPLQYPIRFTDPEELTEPITFIETRPVKIDGVKEGLYTANNIGQVFNAKGQEIKQNLINSGYYVYKLYTGNRKPDTNYPIYKNVLCHRLFAETFGLLTDENKDSSVIDHKNMDKSDNRLSNLEVVSQKENNQRRAINVSSAKGTGVHNSMFSFQDLILIVNEIDKGTPYSNILGMLNIPDTKVNRDYVGNIKRGITYKDEVALIRERKFNDYPGKEYSSNDEENWSV